MVDSIRQIAYLKKHPGVNIRRYELLTILVDFIEKDGTGGATPSALGWLKLFNERASDYGFRTMGYSTFIDHVRKLIDEGLITKKRGLICVNKQSGQVFPLINNNYAPPFEQPEGKTKAVLKKHNPHMKKGFRNEKIVMQMYKQQKGRCWWCGKELFGIYQIDHRVPSSKDGTDDIGNLCLSCPKCNEKKSDKMPWEFNGRLI